MGMISLTSLGQALALEVVSVLFASVLFVVEVVMVDATVATGSLMAPLTNAETNLSYDIDSWVYSGNTKVYPIPMDTGA